MMWDTVSYKYSIYLLFRPIFITFFWVRDPLLFFPFYSQVFITFFLNKISFASVIEASFITLGLQIFGGKRK